MVGVRISAAHMWGVFTGGYAGGFQRRCLVSPSLFDSLADDSSCLSPSSAFGARTIHSMTQDGGREARCGQVGGRVGIGRIHKPAPVRRIWV